MKRFVIGDIHGGYRSFIQVLERASFDKEKDLLIGIGDYVDGWPESAQVIDYLMNLRNFKGVLGNHDFWASDWMLGRYVERMWVKQGGQATIDSYKGNFLLQDIIKHGEWLSSLPYYLEIDNKLFIHGGCKDLHNVKNEFGWDLTWDRSLWSKPAGKYFDHSKYPFALSTDPYDEVYLGHTTTSRVRPDLLPVMIEDFYLIDQGGGWEGKLTLMDIDTKEYWQSDVVKDLYPEIKGRG